MKRLLVLFMVLCMIFSLTACARIAEQKKQAAETVDQLEDAKDQLQDATDQMKDAVENGNADNVSSAASDLVDAIDNAADKVTDSGLAISANAKTVVNELISGDIYKTTVEQFKAQGVLYTIEARDNYLAYVLQYTFDIGDINAFKANCDAQKDTAFKSLADSLLRIYKGIDGVVIEYLDYNGDVIATYTFS